jgi:hypothetical protein
VKAMPLNNADEGPKLILAELPKPFSFAGIPTSHAAPAAMLTVATRKNTEARNRDALFRREA